MRRHIRPKADVIVYFLPGPPQCEKLVIRGDAIEGEILSFQATYRGGAMGTSVAEWTRVEQDRKETVVSNQGEA